MRLQEMTFTAAQVSKITGLPHETIQNWLKRDLIIGSGQDGEIAFTGGGRKGRHRQFSFFALMQFAVAQTLVEIGLGATDATKAAVDFMKVGGECFDDLPDRHPGFPFHHNHGETIFATNLKRTCVELWESDKQPSQQRRDTMAKLRDNLGPHFVSINANEVFMQVCSGIGFERNFLNNIDYRVILDELHPKDATG